MIITMVDIDEILCAVKFNVIATKNLIIFR